MQCQHDWRLVEAKQARVYQRNRDMHKVTKKRLFGLLGSKETYVDKGSGYTVHYHRADDFYCTKCLEDKQQRRKAVYDKPEWWSSLIESETTFSHLENHDPWL